MTHEELVHRVQRLEKSNARLKGIVAGLCAIPLLAIVGWKGVPSVQERLQVKRLEILDERGVPVVAIGTDPQTKGGSIVVRDQLGEKRGWWNAENGGAAFGLAGDTGQEQGGATLGLSARANDAQLSITGKGGGGATSSVNRDQPKIELWDPKGKSLFSAPWK